MSGNGPMECFEDSGHKLFRFSRGPSAFVANIECGARLMNWSVSLADGAVRDVVHWPENAPRGGAGDAFGTVRGGIPVLFPFAGASFAGGRRDFWKTPEGEERPMKMHGYAKCGRFEAEIVSDFGFTALFKPGEDCAGTYPYKYEFRVSYRFNDLSLSCELSLKNLDSRKIPWCAGLHPYFSLPWGAGQTRKMYRLECDAKKAVRFLPDSTFIPEDLFKNCFADPEFNNRILSNFKTARAAFGPKNGEEDIFIRVGGGGKPEGGFCLVTWSEFDDSPFYCVEPWMGPPNSAANPKHFVAPGASKTFLTEISLF